MATDTALQFIQRIYPDAICLRSSPRAKSDFYYILAPDYSSQTAKQIAENVLGIGKSETAAWNNARYKILTAMQNGLERM